MATGYDFYRPLMSTVIPPFEVYTAQDNFISRANCTTNCTNATRDLSAYYCWGHSDSTDIRSILIVTLIFIIIGVVGNTLSVLVFSSKDMRSVSSHVYLLILACSDMGYLLSVFFVKVLPGFRCSFNLPATFDPHNTTMFGCAFFQFAIDLFADLSSCLILAFTVERFIAVYRPADYRTVCTAFRAKVAAIVLAIVITALILPYHVIFMELIPVAYICAMSKKHQQLFSTLYFTEATAFRIIPVVAIAVVNALVVRHFRKTAMRSSVRKSTTDRHNRREEATKRLTKILFLVSTTYVVTYLPSLVHFLLWKMHRHQFIILDDRIMTESREYVNLLYIMGFSINFFLYTVSGPIFRQSLLQLLTCSQCGGCWLARNMGWFQRPSRQDSLVQTDQVSKELQTNRTTVVEESVPLNKAECNGIDSVDN